VVEEDGIAMNIRIHHGVMQMEGIRINQIISKIIMKIMVRKDTVSIIRI